MVTERPSTVQPTPGATAYDCPFCGAYAAQNWIKVYVDRYVPSAGMRHVIAQELKLSACARCKKNAIWHDNKMVYPDITAIPPPNPDLKAEIQEDYREAASIVNKSPRAAAAILRLCVQKLCKQLGQPRGKKINEDIADLVKKGLPVRIQQALDVVRVVGNNAVHPGQIDLKDDTELATKLFDLLNLIADHQLTQPKQIEALFDDLPQGARDDIEKRDRK